MQPISLYFIELHQTYYNWLIIPVNLQQAQVDMFKQLNYNWLIIPVNLQQIVIKINSPRYYNWLIIPVNLQPAWT